MTLSTAERPARGCSVRRKGSETARRARRKAPITRSPNEPELSDAVGSILRGPYPASCMGAGRESYTLGLNEAALYREGDYKMSWPWIQIPGYRCAVGVVRAGFTPGPLLRLCVHPANAALPERRRRDSNPRYPVERYNTLAGCRLQPLGHSSSRRSISKSFGDFARLPTPPPTCCPSLLSLRRLRRASRLRVRRRGSALLRPLLLS